MKCAWTALLTLWCEHLCLGSKFKDSLSLSLSKTQDRQSSCFPTGAAAAQHLIPCAEQYLAGKVPPSPFVAKSSLPASVYVVHGTRFVSRKQNLQKIFAANGIDQVIWLEQFENTDIRPETSECLFQPKYAKGSAPGYGPANAWAQYALYYEMVQKETPFAFVMEDDPAFDEGGEETFKQDLIDLMAKTKEHLTNYDFIHFGGCWGLHGNKPEGGPFYSGPGSRCNNGYVISLSGAQKMLALLRKDAPDIQARISDHVCGTMNHVHSGKLLVHGCSPLQVFMLDPPLYDNGSKVGNGGKFVQRANMKERRLVKLEAPREP